MLGLLFKLVVGGGGRARRADPSTPPPRSLWALLLLSLLTVAATQSTFFAFLAVTVAFVAAVVSAGAVLRWVGWFVGYQIGEAMGGMTEGYREARGARMERQFDPRMTNEPGSHDGYRPMQRGFTHEGWSLRDAENAAADDLAAGGDAAYGGRR